MRHMEHEDDEFDAHTAPDDGMQYTKVPGDQMILKVSNSTDVHKLATSVRRHVESGRYTRVVLSCIGVQTVNQAVKAVAVANERTAPQGYLLSLYPYFHMEKRDQAEHTVIRLAVMRYLIGSL